MDSCQRRSPTGCDSLRNLDVVAIVPVVCVTFTVPDNEVPTPRGTIHHASARNDVVDQPGVDASRNGAPSADAVEVLAGDHHRIPRDSIPIPSVCFTISLNHNVAFAQVCPLGGFSDQASAGFSPSLNQFADVVRAVEVVVIHLREYLSGGFSGRSVQRVAQGRAFCHANSLGGNVESGQLSPHDLLVKPFAVQCENKL